MERSEMESFRTFSSLELARAMPAIDMPILCIPAECDNIILPNDGEIASRWDAYCYATFCRHFASAMLHFASLISHNLRCIPAYTHLIPTGFFQSSLNDYRDNLYIISKLKMGVSRFFQSPQHTLIFVSILVSTDFNQPLRLRFLGR